MHTESRYNRRVERVDSPYACGMGLRIKEIRKAKKLTQADVADKAGMSRPLLAEIENETAPANTLRLAAIARALEVTVEELFEAEDAYRRLIVDYLRDMSADDRAHVLRFAEALAQRR